MVTVLELKAKAKARGVKGYSKMRKSELEAALVEVGRSGPSKKSGKVAKTFGFPKAILPLNYYVEWYHSPITWGLDEEEIGDQDEMLEFEKDEVLIIENAYLEYLSDSRKRKCDADWIVIDFQKMTGRTALKQTLKIKRDGPKVSIPKKTTKKTVAKKAAKKPANGSPRSSGKKSKPMWKYDSSSIVKSLGSGDKGSWMPVDPAMAADMEVAYSKHQSGKGVKGSVGLSPATKYLFRPKEMMLTGSVTSPSGTFPFKVPVKRV